MAVRTLNRRELRKQAEQAGPPEGAAPGTPAAAASPPKKARAKSPAAPRAKRPSKPKVPPRLRARWGVFDQGMKQVAVFDYNQRAAAEQKVADLLAKKKGTHFLQIVKEPMPESVSVAAAD